MNDMNEIKQPAEKPEPKPGGGWQPIETAPKDRKSVLVHRADNKCTYVAIWDDITDGWRHFGGSRYVVDGEITHWMPLPEPPGGSGRW